QSCLHANRRCAVDIGHDIIEEDGLRRHQIELLDGVAKDDRIRLQHSYLRRYYGALEHGPKLMAALEVRHDLKNIVGEGKYPVARVSESARDLFGAVDEHLVIHDVEEQHPGLFGGKAELSLVSLFGLLLG